ncbi:MAG: hypothetical protein ACE5J3_12235 [Methanosarcinales archaeon]
MEKLPDFCDVNVVVSKVLSFHYFNKWSEKLFSKSDEKICSARVKQTTFDVISRLISDEGLLLYYRAKARRIFMEIKVYDVIDDVHKIELNNKLLFIRDLEDIEVLSDAIWIKDKYYDDHYVFWTKNRLKNEHNIDVRSPETL